MADAHEECRVFRVEHPTSAINLGGATDGTTSAVIRDLDVPPKFCRRGQLLDHEAAQAQARAANFFNISRLGLRRSGGISYLVIRSEHSCPSGVFRVH
jgi:hypothetical protein